MLNSCMFSKAKFKRDWNKKEGNEKTKEWEDGSGLYSQSMISFLKIWDYNLTVIKKIRLFLNCFISANKNRLQWIKRIYFLFLLLVSDLNCTFKKFPFVSLDCWICMLLAICQQYSVCNVHCCWENRACAHTHTQMT